MTTCNPVTSNPVSYGPSNGPNSVTYGPSSSIPVTYGPSSSIPVSYGPSSSIPVSYGPSNCNPVTYGQALSSNPASYRHSVAANQLSYGQSINSGDVIDGHRDCGEGGGGGGGGGGAGGQGGGLDAILQSGDNSLVSLVSFFIQVITQAVREVISNGQSLREEDSRLLAQTCIDAFHDSRRPTTSWSEAVKRQTNNLR